ncbi:MAG: hypothetical protein Ct9H300mP1_26590 [Planctomycetaceae bacterium]|nr:MAG: hypothetical protein Ct9H300mP1_26590 [Planctomycetaceae bacterium]
MIGIEPLKTEIKAFRNTLTGPLQNVGKFNSGLPKSPKEVPRWPYWPPGPAAHSEDVSWKKNAKFSGTSPARCSRENSPGPQVIRTGQVAVRDIVEIPDGGAPGELPESKDQAAFSDVADFGYLMQRIDRGFKWIQGNARDEESYKENAAKVRHEAAVLGVLARVIKEEGYGWADERTSQARRLDARRLPHRRESGRSRDVRRLRQGDHQDRPVVHTMPHGTEIDSA